jgi:hypothetical protein
VPDLFGDKKPKLQPRGDGYAGDPGAGPADKKCKDCANFYQRQGGARWHFKCGLVRAAGGPGTDIRMGMPACQRFEQVGRLIAGTVRARKDKTE